NSRELRRGSPKRLRREGGLPFPPPPPPPPPPPTVTVPAFSSSWLVGGTNYMKFVLLVYQGSTPLPGSDRWQNLSKAEQKAIYADYAELNKTEGVAPGLPL